MALTFDKDIVEKTTYDTSQHSEVGETLVWINTDKCHITDLKKDRRDVDMRHVPELAKSIKGRKQLHPCLARVNPKKSGYEIFVGQCRFKAAQMNGEDILLRIMAATDDQVITFIADENAKRKNPRDISQAEQLVHLNKKYKKTTAELADLYDISKGQIAKLMSYTKIPKELKEKLDFTNISAKCYYKIYQLTQEDNEYTNAFLTLIDKINSGKLGEATLEKSADRIIYGEDEKPPAHDIKLKGNVLGQFKPQGHGFSLKINKKSGIELKKKHLNELQKLVSNYLKDIAEE